MAVSMAQLSQIQVQWQDTAPALPPRTGMASYNQADMFSPQDTKRYQTQSPTSYSTSPQWQYQPPPNRHCSWHSLPRDGSTSPGYPGPQLRHAQSPPPLPPKEPVEYGYQSPAQSPKDSVHSTDSDRSFQWSSLEPDLLPPHSNPQALSQRQSEAFTGSQRISSLRLGQDEIWNAETGIAELRILREAARVPSFLSSKPLLTITKTNNGTILGNIRFHTVTSNNIELTINGVETAISHSGLLHNRWGFQPTTSQKAAEKWYWKKDRSTGGAMLEDAKRSGHVIARMKGDLLTFEKGRLSGDIYDEVVMSAIAMAEAARRHKRKSDIADIGSAIGDLTGGDGGEKRQHGWDRDDGSFIKL